MVEDPLNMNRITLNEATFFSMISNVINEEDVVIAPRQKKKLVSILGDEFREVQAFRYLLGKSKFDYNAPQDFPISPIWYFGQRLLNFNQYFAADADYVYFVRFVSERDHL